MKRLVLTITVCTHLGNIEHEFPGFDNEINYQEIDFRVKQILKEYSINRTPILYYRQRREGEKQLKGGQKFGFNVHIFVRFVGDYRLMMNNIKSLQSKYQQGLADLELTDLDVLKFNRMVIQKKSNLCPKRSIIQPKLDLAILISNPLVRKTKEGYQDINRPFISMQKQKINIKQTLERTQPIVYVKIASASELEIESCNHENAQIVQLMCDVQKDQHGVCLLLEDSTEVGLEHPTNLNDLFTSLQKPALVVVVGRHAQWAVAKLQEQGIDSIITVNTICFNTDNLANNFLKFLYKMIFQGLSLRDSFNKASEYACEVKDMNKLRDICCCLHDHKSDCGWIRLVGKFGLEACHNQLHQGCNQILQKCEHDCFRSQHQYMQITGIKKLVNCTNICCCNFGETPDIHHQPEHKLSFWSNQLNSLFHPRANTWEIVETDIIVELPSSINRIISAYYQSEYMIGRNITLYQIVNLLRTKNIINIYDENNRVNIERYTMVRNAVNYLLERDQLLEFIEIDLNTVKSINDLSIQIQERLSPSRNLSAEELSKKMADKELVVLFNNCEEYLKTNQINFTSFFNNKPLRMRIVLLTVMSCPFFIGEEPLCIPGLQLRSALEILLSHITRYRVTLRNIRRTDYQQNMAQLYDGLQRFAEKLKKLELKVTDDLLKSLAKRLACSKIDLQVDRILEELKPHKENSLETRNIISTDLKVLLQLILEFGDGLSEKDLDTMSKLKFAHLIVPAQWRNLLINSSNDDDDYKVGNQQLKVGNFDFFDIMQKYGSNLLFIKANVHRMAGLHYETQFSRQYLCLITLQYLAMYTVVILQLYKLKHQYFQHLFEYTNVSDTGIFFYSKLNSIKNLFDINQCFPHSVSNQLTISESSHIHGQENDIYVQLLDEMNNINPYQSFPQHRQNLLAIYRIDISDFCIANREGEERRCSPSKINRFFYQYYYILLLNIPTLLRIIQGNINREVINYSISNSIKCTHLISRHDIQTKQQKAWNLLLIQLYCIQIGTKCLISDQQQFKTLINKRSREIENLVEVWSNDKLNPIKQVWQIEAETMMLLMHLNGNIISDQLQFIKSLTALYQRLEKSNNIIEENNMKLIMARLTLFTAQSFRKLRSNLKNQMDKCQTQQQLSQALIVASNIYFQRYSIVLYLQCQLQKIYLEMKLSDRNEQSCRRIKEDINKIGQTYINNSAQKITDTTTINLYKRVREDNNNKIWKVSRNLFVFMKADPIASGDINHKVSVRRPSQLKEQIKKALSEKKLDLVGIFKTLTFINLTEILSNPCLLLVLTMDIVVGAHDIGANEQDNLYLRLEHDQLLVSYLLPIKDFLKELYKGNIGSLIICGSNATKMSKMISANTEKGNIRTIIIFDMGIEDYDIDLAQQYFIKIKQQEIIERFLVKYCKQIVKYNSSQSIIQRCVSEVCDELSQLKEKEVANKYMKYEIIKASKAPIDVTFAEGVYTDASGESLSPHNLSYSPEYLTTVGRQSQILRIIKYLTASTEIGQLQLEMSLGNMSAGDISNIQFMNLYGAKGIGKKELLNNIAWKLILKNVFKDGVYRIDCDFLNRDDMREPIRNLMQYIELDIITLFKKMSESPERSLNMLIILLNANKISDIEINDFIRIVEERKIKVIFTTTHIYSSKGRFKSVKLPLKEMTSEQSELLVYSLTQPAFVWGIQKNLRQKLLEGLTLNEFHSPQSIKDQIQRRASDEPKRWIDLKLCQDGINRCSQKMNQKCHFHTMSSSQSNNRSNDIVGSMDIEGIKTSSNNIIQRKRIKILMNDW